MFEALTPLANTRVINLIVIVKLSATEVGVIDDCHDDDDEGSARFQV